MRSYPIWNKVEACIYKSDKSYGAKDTSKNTIYVGTSANNSHELATVTTTRRVVGDTTVFRLGVDGKVIKKIVMCNKTKEILENATV